MAGVDDLLHWRASVRDIHRLKEVFKEDDGCVSAVEQDVIEAMSQVPSDFREDQYWA